MDQHRSGTTHHSRRLTWYVLVPAQRADDCCPIRESRVLEVRRLPKTLDERSRAVHDDRSLPAVVRIDLHLAQIECGRSRRDALNVRRGRLVQVYRPEQRTELPFLLLARSIVRTLK